MTPFLTHLNHFWKMFTQDGGVPFLIGAAILLLFTVACIIIESIDDKE